jgi:hypothetical protein
VKIWFTVAGVGLLLWLLQAFFAYQIGMLTPEQMRASGIAKGIPFTGHGSTWFVLVGLIPLMATLVSIYSPEWNREEILLASVGGLVGSVAMHAMYYFAPYPDFIAGNREFHLAGVAHLLFFAGAIAILILFYFATKHTSHSPALVLFTTWYMIVHVFVGNHMVTRLSPPDWFPPYPLWDVGAWGSVAGVAIILSSATWFALR